MKIINAFVLLIIMCSGSLFSQDTIYFINKTPVASKISEIGINEIKYHRFENTDGPLYISDKSEIRCIKFANGTTDTITPLSVTVVSTPTITYSDAHRIKVSTGSSSNVVEKIDIRGNSLFVSGKKIGESGLKKIILAEQDTQKKTTLLNEYSKLNKYRTQQYVFGFAGLGACIIAPVVGLTTSVFASVGSGTETIAPFVAGLGVGAAAGTTGLTLSIINKYKRTKKKIEIAETYNR